MVRVLGRSMVGVIVPTCILYSRVRNRFQHTKLIECVTAFYYVNPIIFRGVHKPRYSPDKLAITRFLAEFL